MLISPKEAPAPRPDVDFELLDWQQHNNYGFKTGKDRDW
jgi:hypothetical protein